jgi:dienelactone hydrolase
MQTDENGYLIFEPEQIENGLIFYPGGKVEHTAYIPLMEALASEGTLCILVKMPFRLAVFDSNAADGLQENYPEVESWYLGGHSLGGSMAASYLSKHAKVFDGLILLGSYSTADLSDLDVEVLSIYGSEDLVMNRENYEENKKNLPDDFKEVIIDGGCHAYFGMYGAQEGDGVPAISNEEQIARTVEAINEL